MGDLQADGGARRHCGEPLRLRAGPPYLTDDPQPTDPGRWEIYNFVAGARGPDGLGGEAGFDINYGGAPNLQLTAVLPLGFDTPRGAGLDRLRLGAGDVELAVKYRFLHQAEGSWLPDVSVFPRLFAPTAPRRLDTGRPQFLLPVWAEKDAGPWSVFGGGGYELNPGPGQSNFWQGGLAVARALGKRVSVGAEVFGETRDAADGGGYLAADLGGGYRMTEHWSLLASAGPSWERTQGREHGGAVFYLSLKADN